MYGLPYKTARDSVHRLQVRGGLLLTGCRHRACQARVRAWIFTPETTTKRTAIRPTVGAPFHAGCLRRSARRARFSVPDRSMPLSRIRLRGATAGPPSVRHSGPGRALPPSGSGGRFPPVSSPAATRPAMNNEALRGWPPYGSSRDTGKTGHQSIVLVISEVDRSVSATLGRGISEARHGVDFRDWLISEVEAELGRTGDWHFAQVGGFKINPWPVLAVSRLDPDLWVSRSVRRCLPPPPQLWRSQRRAHRWSCRGWGRAG